MHGRGWTTGRAGRASAARGVVRRLDGHLDVVRVALLEPRRRDADELTSRLQLPDTTGADVEHRLPQPADQLVGDGGERAAIRHLALDALGHELVVADVGLEVPVLRVRPSPAAGLRSPERPHAAVLLELLPVDEDVLAGAL